MTLSTLCTVGQSPQQRVISSQRSGVLRLRNHDADPPREAKNSASGLGGGVWFRCWDSNEQRHWGQKAQTMGEKTSRVAKGSQGACTLRGGLGPDPDGVCGGPGQGNWTPLRGNRRAWGQAQGRGHNGKACFSFPYPSQENH